MFLELKNIKKSYANGVEVLKNINISIEKGQFLILVGGSGCGKSTLLNMIAGLETVTSGDIFVDGTSIANLSPKERDIAMVFQSYALYPSMTVYDNIAFGLSLRKISKFDIAEKVKEVAKILQIEHLLTRKPAHLSGGQRQRVAMGRALARAPKLFLFDEPLSNLDAKLRVEMRAEIKRLHARLKTTIVYVTHDQIEAMTLGDVIAVMRDGHVEQFGTPQEIYNNPVNKYVAGFIGSPSMNFIEGIAVVKGVDCGDFLLEMPVNPAIIGKKVTLGLRPENITEENSPFQTVSITPELIEPTGPDTLITFKLNGVSVTARVHPNTFAKINQPLNLSFDMSKALLFDPVTGERL